MTGTAVTRDRTLAADLGLAGGGLFALAAVVYASFSDLEPPRHAELEQNATVAYLARALGDVRRKPEASLVWRGLALSEPVRQGDEVYVPADSEAVLVFGDGARVEVDENSLIVVDRRFTRSGETRPPRAAGGEPGSVSIDVRRGGVVGKAGKGGVKIRAGKAALAMEDGTARVRVGADRSARVAVLEGKGTLQQGPAGGAAVAMEAGEADELGVEGEVRGSARVEIALLSPGPGQRVYFTGRRPQIHFAWEKIAGTGPYRFELSDDPSFEHVVGRGAVQTAATAADAVPLDEGVYYWRVSRKGARGTAHSEERRLVVIQDTPPTPLRPRRGEVVYAPEGTPLGLFWSGADDAGRYRIEVAAGAEFARPVVDEVVDTPSYFNRGLLPEGVYQWRVRVADPDRPDAPPCAPVVFRLITRPLPRAPRLFDPQLDLEPPPAEKGAPAEPDGRGTWRWLWPLFGGTAYAGPGDAPPGASVVLRWEAVDGVSAYLLEIAEDRQFRTVVLREKVDENFYRWRTITQRGYFWRVKSIDADGREGEFSPPRMVGAALVPPDPLAPADGAVFGYGARPAALKWTPSRLATHHIVQVAADSAFQRVVAEERVGEGAEWNFAAPGGGVFYWRARSVDLAEQTTAFGPARSLDVRLPAPRPRQPGSGAAFALARPAPEIRLQWSREPAAAWEVQVARNPEFTPGSGTSVLAASASPGGGGWAALLAEETGLFYWRVRARDGDGRWTDWGPSSWVRLRPAAPLLDAPEDGAEISRGPESATGTASFAWHPAAGAARYLIEVASGSAGWEPGPTAPERAPGAETPEPAAVRTAGTQETRAALDGLTDGEHRWRVRAFDASGAESEPSRERRFRVGPAPKVIEAATLPPPVEPPAEPSLTALEPPPPKPHPQPASVFFLGPRVGASYNLGDLVSPRLQLEAVYHFAWDALPFPLFVSAAAGFSWTGRSLAVPGKTARAESAFNRVPIELRAGARFFTEFADPYFGVGLDAEPYWAAVRVPTQPELYASGVLVGAVLAAGAEKKIAEGRIFAELSFAYTSERRGLFDLDARGLSLALGYRIGLW